jgi:hypothetical protein
VRATAAARGDSARALESAEAHAHTERAAAVAALGLAREQLALCERGLGEMAAAVVALHDKMDALAGQANPKQRIKLHMELKRELEELRRRERAASLDRMRLAREVERLRAAGVDGGASADSDSEAVEAAREELQTVRALQARVQRAHARATHAHEVLVEVVQTAEQAARDAGVVDGGAPALGAGHPVAPGLAPATPLKTRLAARVAAPPVVAMLRAAGVCAALHLPTAALSALLPTDSTGSFALPARHSADDDADEDAASADEGDGEGPASDGERDAEHAASAERALTLIRRLGTEVATLKAAVPSGSPAAVAPPATPAAPAPARSPVGPVRMPLLTLTPGGNVLKPTGVSTPAWRAWTDLAPAAVGGVAARGPGPRPPGAAKAASGSAAGAAAAPSTSATFGFAV